jgi:hypothetical protein
LSDETGAELAEWVGIIAVLLAAVIVLLRFFAVRPDLARLTPFVAVFTSVMAGLAWSVKKAISVLHNRAQVLILEILSDGVPRKREDIGKALAREGILFRVMKLHLDALAELTLAGRVAVSEGAYRIVAD